MDEDQSRKSKYAGLVALFAVYLVACIPYFVVAHYTDSQLVLIPVAIALFTGAFMVNRVLLRRIYEREHGTTDSPS